MRRPARLALGVLAATSLVLTPALAGTAAAAPGKGGKPAASSKPAKPSSKPAAQPSQPADAAKPAKPGKPSKPAKPVKPSKKVVVVGVVTATPTVVTSGSATATVITVKVFGGDKEYRGTTVPVTVDRSAVVKRNHGRAARYELRKGDKVTVHARRDATGKLTAYYVAASGRPATVVAPPSATSTATTTATTKP